MKVRELTGGVIDIAPEGTLLEAAGAMDAAGVGALVVMTDRTLLGIVTERDVVRAAAAAKRLGTERIVDWMTTDVGTVEADTDVADAAAWILGAGYRHLPVVDNGLVVGVVSIKDVLFAVYDTERSGSV